MKKKTRKQKRQPTKPDKTRRDKTPKKVAFLRAYSQVGVISMACRQVGVHRSSVYEWQEDIEFKREMDDSYTDACEAIEATMIKYGMIGVDEPVFHNGKICGHIHKINAQLLLARARAAMPNKYGNRLDVTTANQPLKLYAVANNPDDLFGEGNEGGGGPKPPL